MRAAVISDIHANIDALKAVLRDIAERGTDQVYCAGDLVGYAPFPNEVIELIRQLQIPSVMGNYDDGVGNMRLICGCDYKDEQAQALGEKSILWTKEHTSEENKEYLRNLPEKIIFTGGGRTVLLVHGSPERLNEYICEDTADEYLKEILNRAEADILICGHTHKPFHRTVEDKHVINAGSVGKPKHGDPRATYVIVSFDGDIDVEIRKVPYDYEAAAKAIEQSDLPNEFAELIRTGKG